MKKCYIVIGPRCWGKGRSIKQATANAKKNWPQLDRPYGWSYAAYEVHPDSWVDELGGIVHPIGHRPVEVESEFPIRR